MNSETRNCQNCKNQFTIEPEDFGFYEKIGVPAPTFCYECRFQRRLMFRNERTLYKRTCELCGKSVVAVFSPDKPYHVFCQPCWWSDNWDSSEYAMDYDPSRSFFEQYKELLLKTPFTSLINNYAQLVNSEYINHAGSSKNCYWIFNADFNENVLYGNIVNYVKDSMDLNIVGGGSELCYWDVNCGKCYHVMFSEDCFSCHDVYFSKNLNGCDHCLGCINLRNASYRIFNKPCTKEEFETKLKEIRMDSYASVVAFREKMRVFWLEFPQKYMHAIQNANVSGDYVYYSKNSRFMYQCEGIEDSKFSQFVTLKPAKDVYDLTEWGNGVERVCDSITVGEGADNVKFSFAVWNTVSNCDYCMFVVSSSNMFGCANMRKKQYCILNKQYSKEDYEKLRAKIISEMNERPYVDENGRIWKYGEFFPYNLSLFDYNEATVIQYYPLNKEQVLERGWRWREPTPPEYKITLRTTDIPDSIRDAGGSILNEVLECGECNRPFRVIPAELELLRRFDVPLPRKCPNCRNMERLRRINPPRLWERKCAKCGAAIQTSYAPERKEIVYCESCYNSEVV